MKRFRRRNKFKAKPTGQFKSQLESRIWKQLPHKRKGLKLQYETDRLEYIVRKHYVPDIVVTFPSGRKRYLEVKGWYRPEDRAKMLAAKACNPELDIRLVFASDNVLRKGAKSKYSDWCKKYGFQYCVGEIPKSWFEDDQI